MWNDTMRWLLSLSLMVFGMVLPAVQAQTPQKEPAVLLTSQLYTIAVCGESPCNCGGRTLISQQEAPCEVASSTGSCSSGTGSCCICEAPRSVAVCSDSLCNCTNSAPLTQIAGPCTVTSTAGQCHTGSGQCCVCTLE